MKSPKILREKLNKQWLSAEHREQRFAADFNWPVKLSIGKPSATDFKNSPAKVREHLQQWRDKNLHAVKWQPIKYQSATEVVDIPAYWYINSINEWIAACNNKTTEHEFKKLDSILNQVDEKFHSTLIRQRNLWQKTTSECIIKCCELALKLTPGIAKGRPLRALSISNIDSKFIENNRALITRLLNIIYNNALQTISLENFLDATDNNEHWLLVIPLDTSVLPFEQLRLRSTELATLTLFEKTSWKNLIIIENERCAYQLPKLENTLAILGAGLNLNWLSNPDFKNKNLAYWGDIDSWGLKMLAMARKFQADIKPLLMNIETYNKYKNKAVNEAQIAGKIAPALLNKTEAELYKLLVQSSKGRLEQEFIDSDDVHCALFKWLSLKQY